MESIQRTKNSRSKGIEQFILASGLVPLEVYALPHDASFRRYYRVKTTECSYIVMDAPPPQENCGPFVAIANALREKHIQVPAVLAKDLEQGFLLLSDFGDATYLKSLSRDNADVLYRKALESLAALQACRDVQAYELPIFNQAFMQQEWAWYKEWFLTKWLNIPFQTLEKALDVCYTHIAEVAAKQPQVFMHRDYHSANLMLLPDNQTGILDFQDAFIGPVTYDLVSLLRDCYIDWPQAKVREWAVYYLQQLRAQHAVNASEAEFLRWFDYMGMQRHLKALLTFARKQVRDHQPRYLQYVPRTLNYLTQVSQHYPECAVLYDFLQTHVRPACEAKVSLCAR